MPTLDGDAAIAWMRAKVTNVPGSCLNTIWQAYGSHPSIGDHAGQYPDAIDGWLYAERRHPGDPTPPAGFPVYFDALTRPRYAGDTNYRSGDIVLSLGGGNVICTDGAGAGRIAVMTIPQRARQIGRAYLGWTEDFLGYDVVTATSAAALKATLIDPSKTTTDQEDDMLVIINKSSSVGALAGPGIFAGIPAEFSDALQQSHRVLQADPDLFNWYAAKCLGATQSGNRVYANTTTNVWAVGGPGLWYVIPAGDGDLWTGVYGPYTAVDDADFIKLRDGFLAGK